MIGGSDLSRRIAQALTRPARETLACLRFFSRLPIPRLPFETDVHAPVDFALAVRMLPVAGALIGCIGAVALLLATALHLPPLLAGVAALAALIRTTGGLHEDGLADTADGFGAGADRTRTLAIMKDSRIGAHGTVAVALSLLARAAALAALIERTGPWGAAGAIVVAAALSRVASLVPLFLLPPARSDGVGQAVGAPRREAFSIAFGASAILALVIEGPAVGWSAALFACMASTGASLYVAHLAHRHLGGHTGDVAGAAQQLAELVFLAALLTGTRVG